MLNTQILWPSFFLFVCLFVFPSVDSEITSEENNSTFLNVTEFLKKKIALIQNVKGYPQEKQKMRKMSGTLCEVTEGIR